MFVFVLHLTSRCFPQKNVVVSFFSSPDLKLCTKSLRLAPVHVSIVYMPTPAAKPFATSATLLFFLADYSRAHIPCAVMEREVLYNDDSSS